MNDRAGGVGWWLAPDGQWYPPAPAPPPPQPGGDHLSPHVWLGIDAQSPWQVPDRVHAALSMVSTEPDTFAHRLVAAWERLGELADPSCVAVLADLVAGATGRPPFVDISAADQRRLSDLVMSGYWLGRMAFGTDDKPNRYSASLGHSEAVAWLEHRLRRLGRDELLRVVPGEYPDAAFAVSSRVSLEIEAVTSDEMTLGLKVGLTLSALGLAVVEQALIDERFDSTPSTQSDPPDPSETPTRPDTHNRQRYTPAMDLPVEFLQLVALAANPFSEFPQLKQTWVADTMILRELQKRKDAFDRQTRKSMVISPAGLPYLAAFGLVSGFAGDIERVQKLLGVAPDKAFEALVRLGLERHWPGVDPEEPFWLAVSFSFKTETPAGAASYAIARQLVPALPPRSTDWGVQSLREIYTGGAMVAYRYYVNERFPDWALRSGWMQSRPRSG